MTDEFSPEMLTMFSGEIETDDGAPTVSVPDRELTIGDLQAGETYRVAIFPTTDTSVSDGQEAASNQRNTQSDSSQPVEQGEIIEVEVEDVGDQGDGIARIGPGYIVFVPDAGVGDRVKIEITEARENFAFADVVEHEPVSE